jgi:hypothetical protein
VAKEIPDDDEVLELPPSLDGDDEVPGFAEADELALAEIGDGPEDVGLEVEVGMLDGFEPGVDLDDEPSMLDDTMPAQDDLLAELDADDDDEGGWLAESEGSEGSWDDDLVDDNEEGGFVDDGGLEGVDDPMLDGLDDEETSLNLDLDGDVGEDLGEDLLREIGQEGAVTGRG